MPGIDVSQTGFNKFIVPGAADFTRLGGELRTNLRIFNASDESVSANLTFYRLDESVPVGSAVVTISGGEVEALDSVLSTLFGQTNTGGTIEITTAQPAPLVVTAKMQNRTEIGSTSQFIEAGTANDAASRTNRALQILQLEESERFRSNVGVVEVTGEPVSLEISAVVPDSKVETRMLVQLEGNELKQIGRIFQQLGLGRVYNGRVAVKVISGSGKVLAYGSVIDNSTGDATYVPAQ